MDWIGCHIHEILAEYLATVGGTYHLIDAAYCVYDRLKQTRDRVGPSLFRAMSDWEEESQASLKILSRMRESSGLEDSADREMWPECTHLGRDVCLQTAHRLGGFRNSLVKKRARGGLGHEETEVEDERRRNAMKNFLARQGNGWPTYISAHSGGPDETV